jgi:acyl-CoA synthetase (AMP-forming)/AMP-acid ligase II
VAQAGDLVHADVHSGTTACPRAIKHTHFIRAMYAGCSLVLPDDSGEPVLQTGALVFNGAMVTMLPAFYCGASYHLHRQFDPQAMVATIEREASPTSWWCRRRSSPC